MTYFLNPPDHLANYLEFIWVDPLWESLTCYFKSPIWYHPCIHDTYTHDIYSGLIHFGDVRSSSPTLVSTFPYFLSVCRIERKRRRKKPFMVLRLIHTSYKGLISIYSYDTHKTRITFKLMLSSCRFTFIFGNPTFSERHFRSLSARLLSACEHKFSLFFRAPKILLVLWKELPLFSCFNGFSFNQFNNALTNKELK